MQAEVCRYYLQGRCHYGSRCRNAHPTGGDNDQHRDGFGQQGHYKWSAGQRGPEVQLSSPEDVVNSLPKEMQLWEESKMWPFSCVAMEKDLPCLPDFNDVSPEELRSEAYTAMKDGSLQAYLSKVQGLVLDYTSKRQQLKLPSLDLKKTLVQLLENQRKKENSFAKKSSVFGASSGSSFGSGTGNGLFGKPAQSTNQGTFGSASTNQGLFGSSAPSQGLFGSGNNTGGSIFGGSSSGLNISNSASTTPGIFGNTAPTASFGSTMATSTFGSGMQEGASTTQTSSGQGFGSPSLSPPTGLFGNAGTAAASPAGATPGQAGGRSLFSSAPQKDLSLSTVYTAMDKLTEEEKAQFMAPSFTLGKVPMKPPPREMIMDQVH